MTVFTVLMLLIMIVGIGMGADFMRHETYRAELQNALDRGALAATSFSQTEDPQVVIEQYVNDSVRWKQLGVTPVVSVTRTPADDTWYTADVAERSISATASVDFRTHFLRFMEGTWNDTMAINVATSSSQRQKRTEIILVLDISYSMDANDTSLSEPKVTVLKREAKKFVNQLLTPETAGSTTVTLVPFGGHVNPGVFGELMEQAATLDSDGNLITTGVTPLEFPASSDLVGDPFCPTFTAAEFTGTAADEIDLRAVREQKTWFKAYGTLESTSNTGSPRWGWCPFADTAIIPMSNDATAINASIDAMTMYAGTGIDVALKWASYLSSDKSNPAIKDIMSAYPSMIDSKFINRPSPDSDADTNKIIVFLTDGEITEQREIKPELMGVDASLRATGTPGATVADLKAELEEAKTDPAHHYVANGIFNVAKTDNIISLMESHVGTTGLLADFWAIERTDNKNISRGNIAKATEWNNKNGVNHSHYNTRSKLEALENVEFLCDRLRARGNVQVFTIGFNIAGLEDDSFVVPADAATADSTDQRSEFVLGHCAIDPGTGSDASNRYLASGSNLGTVFTDISTEIFALKLTN